MLKGRKRERERRGKGKKYVENEKYKETERKSRGRARKREGDTSGKRDANSRPGEIKMSRVYRGTNTPSCRIRAAAGTEVYLKNLLRSCHLRFKPRAGLEPRETSARSYRDLTFLSADSRVDKPLTADKPFAMISDDRICHLLHSVPAIHAFTLHFFLNYLIFIFFLNMDFKIL